LEKALPQARGRRRDLHVVYEAGPTGFGLYRRPAQLQIDCIVVAPSKIPHEKAWPEDDRRDAEQLAAGVTGRGTGRHLCPMPWTSPSAT